MQNLHPLQNLQGVSNNISEVYKVHACMNMARPLGRANL